MLQLLILQRNYSHISTYVFKADAALDAATASGSGSGSTGSSSKKGSAEREKVQSKLDFATALSHLGQSNYEKAAYYFLRLGPSKQLGDWAGKLVAPGDIAIYGTLCALSKLSRSAIKAQVVDNDTFAGYIEQEPYVRELIGSYMNSNFKTCLEILSRYSVSISVPFCTFPINCSNRHAISSTYISPHMSPGSPTSFGTGQLCSTSNLSLPSNSSA